VSANTYQDRLIAFRRSIWWDLKNAHVIHEPMTLEAAGQRAGIDFEIFKRPLWTIVPPSPERELVGPDGIPLVVPATAQRLVKATDIASLWRGADAMNPQEAQIGWCAANYPILQNMELLRMLEPIAQHWPVESIGALGKGETLILSLNMGGWEMMTEEYTNRFGLIERRDGGHKLLAMFTTTRMVCENTALQALRNATFKVEIPHVGDFKANAQFAFDLMARMEGIARESWDTYATWAATPIYREQITEILERMLPEPKRPALLDQYEVLKTRGTDVGDLEERAKRKQREYDRICETVLDRRKLVDYCYDKLCDESPIGGTAWGFYQATVEVADQEKGGGDRALSALVGDRAQMKIRAAKLIGEVVLGQ
jgi:hypothetical protein